MATSRQLRDGDRLVGISEPLYLGDTYVYSPSLVRGYRNRPVDILFVLAADFHLPNRSAHAWWAIVGERVFGIPSCVSSTDPRLAAAITNGAAPGLYVREGDDTSNWETYRQVLARRVEEAMATRRGGEGGVGVGETVTTVAETTAMRQQPRQGIGVLSDGREVAVDPVTGHVVPAPTTRQDDEIRVGDVVEVVSCSDIHYTRRSDIGCGGRITQRGDNSVQLIPVDGMRLPGGGIAAITDVRKVASPSLSPQTGATIVSPMTDQEAARIEAAVTEEVRRRISSPLASSGYETTIQRVVNPAPPAVSVSLRPRDFTAAAITDHLRSLGATQVHVRQAPGNPPVVEVAGLSRQAFDTACQNLPVGIQLRAVGGFLGERNSGETTEARIIRSAQSELLNPPPQPQQPTQPLSRFSLLEVDADVDAAPPSPLQALKAPVDLAALQAELRAEREAKRALAAAQTPPGRFDLLECDLPAAPAAAKPVKSPQSPHPVVSSSPKPLNPVETITDLTTARSPLEFARMLEGLNDELSTMMRQREAN